MERSSPRRFEKDFFIPLTAWACGRLVAKSGVICDSAGGWVRSCVSAEGRDFPVVRIAIFGRQGVGRMSISLAQVVIVALVVVLLFGRGRVSALMGDVAKGIKSFRKSMDEGGLEESEDESSTSRSIRTVDSSATDREL